MFAKLGGLSLCGGEDDETQRTSARSARALLAGVYWSSTTFEGAPDNAFLVGFYAGDMDIGPKTDDHAVRAVRGAL